MGLGQLSRYGACIPVTRLGLAVPAGRSGGVLHESCSFSGEKASGAVLPRVLAWCGGFQDSSNCMAGAVWQGSLLSCTSGMEFSPPAAFTQRGEGINTLPALLNFYLFFKFLVFFFNTSHQVGAKHRSSFPPGAVETVPRLCSSHGELSAVADR